MNLRKRGLFPLALACVVLFAACTGGSSSSVPAPAPSGLPESGVQAESAAEAFAGEDEGFIADVPREGDEIEPADYADADNWMAVAEAPEKPVDVFVLYPTAWQRQQGEKILCPVDHEGMRLGAQAFLDDRASCMREVGNVFAPYYRQMDATYLLGLPIEEQNQYIRGASKTDVLAAFDYYIQHYNEGRPFLLFSHSQGSSMSIELLKDYMEEHPEVYERMVAAYVIGYAVTEGDLEENPHLRFAQGADDTGVIISYNTEAPEIGGDNPVWLEGAIAINPINWKRDGTEAPAEESLGSHIQVDGAYQRVEHLANAAVDTERGVVVCSSVDTEEFSLPAPLDTVFPSGVYHGSDIDFYYYNLAENGQVRTDAFLRENDAAVQ
ncbi:DUF3089 domain-containing protein [Ruminococcaceae bacterium OttesenSCG-928-I18]|nr:DUF3089 domain-containing protein [Ruminococcaceae bacterium OttesenSCG-928-I18]